MAVALEQTAQRSERSLQRALAAARTADDNRGRDIVVLDLRELTQVFDYFVLVTGSSRRQLHSISEEIDQVLERDYGDHRLGLEGYVESRWILLDFGDVVVHLFDSETRNYYALEQLWAGTSGCRSREPLSPPVRPLGRGNVPAPRSVPSCSAPAASRWLRRLAFACERLFGVAARLPAVANSPP